MTRAKLEEIKKKQKIKNRRYMIGAIIELIVKSILTIGAMGLISSGIIYLFIADIPESQDSINKRTKYIERIEEEKRREYLGLNYYE